MSTLTDLQNPLRAWLADDRVREAALLSAGYQGSVYLFEWDDQRWVVKRAGQGLLTGWLHRLMLRREGAVYEQLSGVAGVPKSLGMLDDKWLVLQFMPGESLRQARFELTNPEQFYSRLHKVIGAIHAAGVAHGDLKRKDNILVLRDEHPCVIDFGTALRRDGAFLDRLLFDVVARADFNAWIKVKYANDYTKISSEDAQWHRPSMVESVLRAVRRFWRAISFRQARKRRRRRHNQ
jgi:predicted Ser/Thr protein kinase